VWTALITYDGGTNLLNVTLTDPAEGGSFDAISDYSIDISGLLGTNTAYVGFTGGTGAGWQNEDILNWTFANTATLPPPPTGVPEPDSLGLFGLGLLGLGAGAFMRRKKLALPGARVTS
ncbi:MAG: PEP-CTERM sorting domain-containing protein, partial [Rhodanobacteraceae bacterium]